jgi:threonine synthase
MVDRLPKLSVIQAEGSAPLAHLFGSLDPNELTGAAHLPDTLPAVAYPQTLATAIKIGAPVSWRKALRAVLQSHGQIMAVSEQEIADAKAMIGRDGIGCEPASATTVAGIRKLLAGGHIGRDEYVVAVLTGHVLKDPDYVSNYHRGTLSLISDAEGRPVQSERIAGAFQNAPESVPATKAAILEKLQRGC